MEKLFDNMLHRIAEGAAVVAPIVPTRNKEKPSMFSSVGHEAAQKIKQIMLRRIQKSRIPYRLRMAW